jgi:hypothetical protein
MMTLSAAPGVESVQRYANYARLLCQRLENRLADPPHRVRDELDSLRLVELVRGADETEVALVDQIGERDALILILLGHRHDEPEVRAHQLVQRLLIVHPNALRQSHLFLTVDQRIDADVTQVLVERAFVVRRLFRGRWHSWTTGAGRAAGTNRERSSHLTPGAELNYETARTDLSQNHRDR